MDPQSNQAGAYLSQPQSAEPAVMPLPPQPAGIAMPGQPPVMPVASSAPTAAVDTSVEPALAPINHSSTGPVAPAAESAPAEAADSDVIEKEWVQRAKQVVTETRIDPYRQALAINQLKADYMKKRYNKDIKLPDA